MIFFSLYFFNHTKPCSCQKNSPIIKNNLSSCKHKSWNGDSYRKTKNVLLTVRENLSLQSLGFSLPTLCWLLGERKWKRARFYPPENNSNPVKHKSNIQSTSQETILKPKTSQWKIHLSAAGMCEPLHLPLSRLQPQNNPNHTTPPVLWGQDAFLFPSLPPYHSRSFSPSHLSFLYSLHPTHAKLLFFSYSLLSAAYQQTHNCFEQKGNCGSSLCRLEIEEWQLLIRSTNLNQGVFFWDSPAHKPGVLESVMICIVYVFNYPGSVWGLVPNPWVFALEDHMTPTPPLPGCLTFERWFERSEPKQPKKFVSALLSPHPTGWGKALPSPCMPPSETNMSLKIMVGWGHTFGSMQGRHQSSLLS